MAWKLLAALSLGALIALTAASIAASKASLTYAAGKAAAPQAPAAFNALAGAAVFCGPKKSQFDDYSRACGPSPRKF